MKRVHTILLAATSVAVADSRIIPGQSKARHAQSISRWLPLTIHDAPLWSQQRKTKDD